MKTNPIFFCLSLFILLIFCSYSLFSKSPVKDETDDVQAFKNLMIELKNKSTIDLFALHYQSIIDVIDSKSSLTKSDSILISTALVNFTEPGINGNASLVESYLNRGRQLVISWISPTDGKTSFLRLRLPANWKPNMTYPLYVELHGLWSVADNPIDFMTYNFRRDPSNSFSFEDGYLILPWGRGNQWYQGISEIDIMESIDVIESLVSIDQRRKYLTGHSMGGFGTWYIACRTTDIWAAIGVHAGALWYASDSWLTDDKIEAMSEMPVYFVVGTSDGLYDINLETYNRLLNAGNSDVKFVSFNGGHDYFNENVENMYLWLRDFVNYDYTDINSVEGGRDKILSIYPNPVSENLVISFNVDESNNIRISIYDVYGRKIDDLINDFKPKGVYTFNWSANNSKPGVYCLKYSFGDKVYVRTFILK